MQEDIRRICEIAVSSQDTHSRIDRLQGQGDHILSAILRNI